MVANIYLFISTTIQSNGNVFCFATLLSVRSGFKKHVASYLAQGNYLFLKSHNKESFARGPPCWYFSKILIYLVYNLLACSLPSPTFGYYWLTNFQIRSKSLIIVIAVFWQQSDFCHRKSDVCNKLNVPGNGCLTARFICFIFLKYQVQTSCPKFFVISLNSSAK